MTKSGALVEVSAKNVKIQHENPVALERSNPHSRLHDDDDG